MIGSDGLLQTLRYAGARLVEECYELRFGIRTVGHIPVEDLGTHDPDAIWYLPTPYQGFFATMRHVPVSGAFVDYGSGLGRILIAAARFPFVRVTGLELSDALVRRSLENVARCRGTHCKRIEVIGTNAARWRVPNDVTVFHFYSPFLGQTLRAVVADIARSLSEAPRKAWIMFAYPHEMDPLMRSGEVIPRQWQKQTVDEVWPLYPVLKHAPPGGNRYRVYALDSAVG